MQISQEGWAALGALGFAAVGAGFGALVGWAGRRGGVTGGTRFGWAAARGLGLDPEDPRTRTVAGAVDGALFLAVVGAAVGLLGEGGGLGIGLVTLVALCMGASLFGGLAYLWVAKRYRLLRALAGTAVGGLVGLRQTGDRPLGALGGAVLGFLVAELVGGRSRSREQPAPAEDEPGPGRWHE